MKKFVLFTVLFFLVSAVFVQARTNGELPRPTTAQPKPWISQDADK